MDVSVILVCRNEARHMREVLNSMLAQRTEQLSVEFLVADGMSEDGTRDIIREYATRDARIRLIDNPGHIVSTGLNAAIAAARGEVIIRMDAHTEFDPSYVTSCLTQLHLTGADNVGGPARTKATTRMARAIAAAYHSPFSTGGASFHNVDFEGWVDTVTYGCWHREVFQRIGLFDEQLVRNQDDEFNLRLVRAGGTIWQSPEIISWYQPRSSLSKLFQQYFQYGFWKVAVIRKHRLPASWRHLVPCAFILVHVLLCSLLLAGLGTGSHALTLYSGLSWAAVLAAYTLGVLLFSIHTARTAGWDLLMYLPAVFATFHFSYGLGFMAGLVSAPGKSSSPGNLFTQLSR
jgi:succinoglycan biosynthesis protein ExoA